MATFKTKILRVLNEIKGSGSFVSHHEAAFEFPGLEVDGMGEISYPVNEVQAKSLINKAHRAPFGKGTKTILDDKVRRGWEIDASDLTFTAKGWDGFLDKVLDQVKPDLGIEDYTISVSLYKMLIYEEDDFFLPHKDTEKEKGMFGTLLIALPSKHSGGELMVRFDGKEKRVDFSGAASHFKMPYAAFYADCEHEVKPVTSGYRICLVYNLIQQETKKKVTIEPLGTHVNKFVGILHQDKYDPEQPTRIILLGHQYTPDNFSIQSLKLNDRPKAEALLRAAKKADYYAKMALVTSYLTGSPANDGYYGYYEDYDQVDDDDEMGEVHDESLSIEHWMDDGLPPLDVSFEEDDLIVSFHLNDDEPIIKESTGYMGNWGPDLMHWYHYGAVILWPKKNHAALLLQQDTTTKLAWIEYYNSQTDELTDVEVSAMESLLSSDFNANERKKSDYTPIVEWLIHRDDEHYFIDTGINLIQQHFVKMDVASLAKLADTYPGSFSKVMTKIMAGQPEVPVFEHFLSLLNVLPPNPELDIWKLQQLKALPRLLASLIEKGSPQKPIINTKIWRHILELEEKLPESPRWVEEMANLITTCRQRKYINKVLMVEILGLKHSTPLSEAVLKICKQDLQQRVNNKPQPPANWSRALPDTKGYAQQWAILASFLQSPNQSVFDYSAKQADRSAMEHAIKDVTIDLTMQTIRKGSPHTLRITKTEASYHRKLRRWEEDVTLLNTVRSTI